MHQEFVELVRELVDAVIYAECTIDGSEDSFAVEVTVNAALAVVREIRATEEFSSLHQWAGNQLSTYANSEGKHPSLPG